MIQGIYITIHNQNAVTISKTVGINTYHWPKTPIESKELILRLEPYLGILDSSLPQFLDNRMSRVDLKYPLATHIRLPARI